MDIRRRTQIGGIKKTSSGEDDVIPEPIINIDNYLTVEALEDELTVSLSTNACEYCVDGDGNWKTLVANTTTESINSGHILSFKGNLTPVKNVGIGTFTITKNCNLSGKCASMLYGDNTADNYSISGKKYAFCMLFTNNNTVIDASRLELPTNTSDYCYNAMFYQCRNLINTPTLGTSTSLGCYNSMFRECDRLVVPPVLPATAIASGCYRRMFQDCPSLLTAPELPAKNIDVQCYQQMFYGCTNLTTAPVLPATTLKRYCYSSMFEGCSKLNYIKMLATSISASDCLSNWVTNVASSGTFVKNANMTSLPTGTSGIPSGWTVQNATS